MDSTLIYELLAILMLILANGLFALSEFSIIASRRSKLRQKVHEGKPGAVAAEKLHNKPDKFLASIQVGITLFGTLAGVFGGATLVDQLQRFLEKVPVEIINVTAGPISVVIVALVITTVAVVVGELVPKYLALSHPERYARYVATPVTLFMKISGFFAWLLSWLANLIVRSLGVKQDHRRAPITEEEINLMIFEGREKGVFDAVEEKLIKSVFDFADSTVRRAMTPRTDVIGIEFNATADEIIDLIIEHGFSRYPVYESTIDNIAGVLHAKDIIVQKLNPELIIVKDLCRQVAFVPDSMPLSKLLSEFQRTRSQMAIVLDEFGGTAGIITLEDILEELVGEIQDEYDSETDPLVKHSEKVAYCEASVWPGSVNELMNTNLPEEQIDTMAGLVIDHLGRLPEKNEAVDIENTRITVIQRDENRLIRLRIEKISHNNHKGENF